MLITFSGLDGAGKTTLIKSLAKALGGRNHRTIVLAVYDHIGVYPLTRYLRDRVKGLIRGRRGELAPAAMTVSTDPDRLGTSVAKRGRLTTIIYTAVRSGIVKRVMLPIDLLIFLFYRLYFEVARKNIFITDRYFYDSLADVLGQSDGLYMWILLRLIPNPDMPIFVDVSPEVAFARKGEYSLEYLVKRRVKYQKIFDRIDRPVILSNDELTRAEVAIQVEAFSRMDRR